jgi:hypothetical protein
MKTKANYTVLGLVLVGVDQEVEWKHFWNRVITPDWKYDFLSSSSFKQEINLKIIRNCTEKLNVILERMLDLQDLA